MHPRPERPVELSEVSINIHIPLPPPRSATEIPMGGGVQKEVISEGVGIASRVFFRGLRVRFMSKQSVILPLIDFSKQKLLFSSMIFYLRPASCFFHRLHDSLCNTIVVSL